jgi:broad specificity phosphatase PhoE
MSDLQGVYLARHGETEWSRSGQHTSFTDLPLTARGEVNAQRLGQLIGHRHFVRVLVSPLRRTRQTCELAGFSPAATLDGRLVEWNYGQYEGLTTAEIRVTRPDWQLYRDGCPGGESPHEVAHRADAVIAEVRSLRGDVLLFSSGHFLRVLAARWLDLSPEAAKYFLLTTATLSILGDEHTTSEPVIRLWNDDRHAAGDACVEIDTLRTPS